MTAKETIKQIISEKQNLFSEGEGYSIFQCSTCTAIVNKFHIKIIEHNKILFENKPDCFRCKTEMKLNYCDQDKNIIEDIKCSKCKSNDIRVVQNMLWD